MRQRPTNLEFPQRRQRLFYQRSSTWMEALYVSASAAKKGVRCDRSWPTGTSWRVRKGRLHKTNRGWNVAQKGAEASVVGKEVHMKCPHISVCICTYRKPDLLERT